MANNHKNDKQNRTISETALREMLRDQKIAARAVEKAQEENRLRGIPNYYSIGGKIISDKDAAGTNGE